MTTYSEKRHRTVEAVQIIEKDGEATLNEFPDWIVELLAGERGEYISGFGFDKRKPYPFIVSCDKLLTLPIGSYIYLDLMGFIHYLDEKTFESKYEKAYFLLNEGIFL